jgi:hypothetical protein
MDNDLTVGWAVGVVSESTLSRSKQPTDAKTQTVEEAIQITHASVQTLGKQSRTVL